MQKPTRVTPTISIETLPHVTCDDDGVVVRCVLGDTLESWRMPRHLGLAHAGAIIAAVSEWSRKRAEAEEGEIIPFPMADAG